MPVFWYCPREMKLVRYIASCAGIPRRRAMELLKQGQVRIDGKPVADSTIEVIAERDRVTLSGRPLAPLPDLHFVMYKPRKTICTKSDPEGRPTVMSLLARGHRRANPVGRLDFNTTGVMLLTTDGEMAERLLKSGKVPRQYMVKLKGSVSDEGFDRWRRGLVIDGKKTSGATVHVMARKGDVAKVMVTLTEGWYHLIHRMAERTGMRALKIHRTRFGGISLGGLKPGMYRPLTKAEVRHLKRYL
jgi:23S rRNA pseudouridine2605 synthase